MTILALGPVASTLDAAQTAKLKEGAKQFEAMMLQEMLKPLQFGGGIDEGDEPASGAADTVRGFATEAVGKALAASGGFGLAKQIVRQVTAEHEAQSKG